MQPPFARAAGLFLFAALAISLRTSAANGTLTIHLANDSTNNLLVTLYDRNLRRHQTVISGQMIYGNASIGTTISADASGQGHVFWSVMTADRDMRQCGQRDKRQVNDGETIHVSADGPCSHHH